MLQIPLFHWNSNRLQSTTLPEEKRATYLTVCPHTKANSDQPDQPLQPLPAQTARPPKQTLPRPHKLLLY